MRRFTKNFQSENKAAPFLIAGSIIVGTFLFNFVVHLVFEDQPFFSHIEGHTYHLYLAALGLVILAVYLLRRK